MVRFIEKIGFRSVIFKADFSEKIMSLIYAKQASESFDI